jgi:hypothetical protein
MTNKINNFMKRGAGRKLLVVLLALGLTVGASAQRHIIGGGGGGYYYRPAYVGVGFGYGYPLYPYYGMGFGYPYPPYYYGYGATPPRLEYQIQDIKSDYSARIKDVKSDKALTGKERRQQVRDLKNARDASISQARHDFFYGTQRQNSNAPQPYKGNDQAPGNQPLNNQPLNNQPSNNGKPQSNTQPQNNSNEQPEYSEKGGQ